MANLNANIGLGCPVELYSFNVVMEFVKVPCPLHSGGYGYVDIILHFTTQHSMFGSSIKLLEY